MGMVNQQQLFNLHKSQGSDIPSNPAPDTNLPTLLVKKPTRDLKTPQHMILQSSSEDETEDPSILETSLEDTGSFSHG